MIVRSSGPNESMDMRGQLESIVCESVPEKLAEAMRNVAFQVRGEPMTRLDVPACAIVLQPFAASDFWGHLSNEYRLAQRSVDFVYEVEGIASQPPRPATFRLQRPVAAPEEQALSTGLHLKDGARGIEKALKMVGAWLAAQNVRGHIEWLVTQKRLMLVQLDVDPLPAKIVPMSEVTLPCLATVPDVASLGSAFVPIAGGADFSGLRKTRSHALLQAAGAFVPPIFVARDVGERILDRQSDFWRELTCLLSTPAVIRFDVPLARTEWTNLPTIGPLSSPDEAWRKVASAVESVRARGIELGELAVVVHHFIAARGAAWSEANPYSTQVRIDSTWGLPDGLQSFVHDSVIYNGDTGEIAPHIRYKDRFIDVTVNGEWVIRKAPPSIAGEEACKIQDVKAISNISINVARAANRTVRIMWFLDVLAGGGGQSPSAMPWIVVEVEGPVGVLGPALPAQPVHTAQRRQAELHAERAVKNRHTLERFRRTPSAMDVGGRHVLLQPDASTVRDRTFLAEFAHVVLALPHHWKVLYAGSMLAHAPYQLQQLGVPILPLHYEVRPSRRTYMRKLVRDGIPARIVAGGEQADVVQLDETEFQLALRQKLVEEALEVVFSGDWDELREELADLLTVARALAKAGGVDAWAEVEKASDDKTARRGGFVDRFFLRSTGFSRSIDPVTPGGAEVQRLRSGVGIRIPLVPPLLPAKRASSIEFRRLGMNVEVEFREHYVHVRFASSRAAIRQESLQLPLFDLADDDDG
ncbi:MAG: nucleoside triphosphate pyrophosphohydrolase [Polyangiaceae bacterium]|nr:nucleoside triphosphate pyrophosphohydrolase [Polyangiaceae bacterium]